MAAKQTQGYSALGIAIHWLMAVVLLGLFAVGLWMVDLNYYSAWYQTAPYWHKSVGVLLMLLLALRIVLKLTGRMPAPNTGGSPKLVHLVHALLYLLPLLLGLSGYLISTADGRALEVFGLFQLPATLTLEGQEDIAGEIHSYLAWGLIGIAALHALAALKHHLIDKDDTLNRMLKPNKEISR